MKNLKQVLALGMAFSLTMSAMAGAAFTDQDSINKENVDAVQLLSTLDIIKGYEDGSFNPTKPVTRAEMAKMIYTIRNGGNANADAYKSVSTSFTDIQGHWAEGYIKYLQSTDIIAGKSATKFDPDSTVTTVEAMKMALVLGGYRADKAGIYGAQWANKTISLATTNGLTDNVYSSMDGGCTRQDAAQILANVLEMDAVQWSEVTQSFLKESDAGLSWGAEPMSVGYKWMDLVTKTGFVTRAPSSKTNPKGVTVANVNFNNVSMDVSDLLGYEVKVVYDADKQKKNEADAIYGIYKTEDNVSYDTAWKDVDQDGAKVKFGGTSYKVDATGIDVYHDAGWNAPYNVNSSYFDNKALADTVTFIDSDGDGDIDAAQIHTKAVAEVTYVGSKNITTKTLVGDQDIYNISYDTTPELVDVTTYEGIAKNDFAVVSYDVYSDKVTYEKAEVKTGNIEATRTKNNTLEVKIDGNWMKATEGYKGVQKLAAAAGDTVEYVAIDNLIYNIKKIDGTWGSNSIAMIYNVSNGTGEFNQNKVIAQIIKRDGSTENVEVGKIDGTSGAGLLVAAQGKLGVPMTYRVVDGSYEFKTFADKDATTQNTAGFDDMKTSNAAYVAGEDKYNGTEIADDAIVFMYDNGGTPSTYTDNGAKVISGAELKKTSIDASSGDAFKLVDSANGDAYLVSETNGFNYVYCMSVAMNDLDNAAIKGRNYGYLLSDAWEAKGADGKWYRAFSLWTEAGEITAYQETGNEFDYKSGTVITYEVTSTKDGITYIKSVDEAELKLGKVDAVDGNYVGLDGTKAELVNDSVVLNVNTDDQEGISGGTDARGQIAEADLSATGKANVRYVLDSNDKIIFILIDTVNNEIMSGENKNMSQSAVKALLADAKSGETVTLEGEVPEGNYKVPKGVAVDLSNATISGDVKFETKTSVLGSLFGILTSAKEYNVVVSGTLTIEEKASLIAGGVKFADDGKIVVNGTLTIDGVINAHQGDVSGKGTIIVGDQQYSDANDVYDVAPDTAVQKVNVK